jgi:hypothetical protein
LNAVLDGAVLMNIGGVAIRLTSAEFDIVPSEAPEYAEFLGPRADSPASSEIAVRVTLEPPPTALGAVVFDSGSPWVMRHDGTGFRLEFIGPDPGKPHLVVRADHTVSDCTLHLCDHEGARGPRSSRFEYPVDELILMNHLASRSGVLVHSAGLRLDPNPADNGSPVVGLVFPGASGAGKTTLSRLLQAGGLGAGLLSDDRIILRETEDAVTAWGTPWPGDAKIARNTSVPLGALLFLTQADEDGLTTLTKGEALRRLLPVVSCPWYDRERLPAVLDTCGRIVERTPCQELRFSRTGAVADVVSTYALSLRVT